MIYKTKMCRIWQSKGVCDNPDCRFAHGPSEPRPALAVRERAIENTVDFSRHARMPQGRAPGESELLRQEGQNLTCGRRTHCAGVMPVCIDPETRMAYALLGAEFARDHENDPPHVDGQGRWHRRVVLCSFHGWVEPGETLKQGAAREAAEESRGVFATQRDLLRCLLLPAFHRRLCDGVYIVSLGEMTSAERDALCARFRATVGARYCENEMLGIHFVVMSELRAACLRPSEGACASGRLQTEPHHRELTPEDRLGSARWPVASFPAHVWLRSFLQDWLTHRTTDWRTPWMQSLCTGAADFARVMRSIHELPELPAFQAAAYEAFLCTDRELQCRDCSARFTHTAPQQLLFRQQGWEDPPRCATCRKHRRGNREAAAARGGGGGDDDPRFCGGRLHEGQ